MPGLFGILSKRPQALNEKELDIMGHAMHMEPFYNRDTVSYPDMGIYAGWTCHNNSFSDCLPIENEKKDIILLYHGENFMEKEDINKLKGRNHQFRKFDASYIVHMYEEWGENFLKMLNGRHHGLLIDNREEKVILFNDRYGLQRTYCYEGADAFYFSSEAKTLLKVCPHLKEIDMESLAEFLLFGSVMEDRTLFKDVYLLPGAAHWILQGSNRNIKKSCYFEPAELLHLPLLEKEFQYNRLKKDFRRIIKRYYLVNEDIGVYISAGLDNQILLANIKFGKGKLKCYTLDDSGGDSECDHLKKNISDIIGQTLQPLSLGSQFILNFNELAEKALYITDGNLNLTGTIDLFLSEKARALAHIQLSELYGGHILRSQPFLPVNKFNQSIFNDDFIETMTSVANRVAGLEQKSLLQYLNIGLPRADSGILCIRQSQLVVRNPFIDNDFIELMFRAPDEVRVEDKVSTRLIRDGNHRFAELPEK